MDSYKNNLNDSSSTNMDSISNGTLSSDEDIFNSRLSSQMWSKIENDLEKRTAGTSTQIEEIDIIAHLRIMHRYIQNRCPKKSIATQTSPIKENINEDYRQKMYQKTDIGKKCDFLFETPIFPKVKKSLHQRLMELENLN